MKKKSKKIKTYLVAMFAFIALTFSVKAEIASAVFLTTAPTNGLVRAGYALVSTVVLSTTNALGTMVHFIDSATNNVTTYVVLPYTNRVVYTTNLVNNYVTTTGVTNYFTNLVQISRNEAKIQTTNAFPIVGAFYIPGPNIPQTFTLDAIFARGVLVSNSTAGATVVVNYRRP